MANQSNLGRLSRIGLVAPLALSKCLSIGLCLLLLGTLAFTARAGSIFDEDWVPPKPAYMPPKAQPSPPVAVPSAPKADPQKAPAAGQQPTVSPPSVIPSPPAAMPPVKLLAIPASSEQARSRELLRTAFADQLKDRSSSGRKKLAKSLIDEVPKTADNPSDQFVLLGGAIDAAKEAGEVPLCFQAADLMAARYAVDGLNVKTDAILKLNVKSVPANGAVDTLRAALDLIDPLVAVADFTTALRVLAQVKPLAAGDAKLLASIQQRSKAVDASRVLHERLMSAIEKLKTSPSDPAANQVVGSYLCFNKGDWAKGLPILANAADVNLKRLAALEISAPQTPADIRKLADGWWEVATKQPESSQPEVMVHAAELYKQLLGAANGLERTILEKRIAEAGAISEKVRATSGVTASRIQLLKLIDPSKDTVQGKFAIQNGELVNLGSGQQRIAIPYHPPREYDFQVEFTRSTGKDCVIQILSREGTPFIWVLQNKPMFHYRKEGVPPNGAVVKRPDPIENGKRYISLVQVRDTGAKAFLNGELITEWKTDYKDINPAVPFWLLKDNACLGIGIGGTGTTFHSATLIEVTGSGKPTR